MVNSAIRPSSVRSSGTKPTPASRTRRGLCPTSSWPSSVIEPSSARLQPHDRLGELGLAVALHAGDREDLAAAHLERDVRDDVLAAGVDDREVLRRRARRRPASACGLLDHQLDGAADHHRRHLGVGVGRLRLADDLAEADDGDLVGDLAHLAQLVRDEHDRGALVAQLAHDAHQLVGLLRGQHRGRLVEDQHLRVLRQRLDDLDALLHADRQVLDEGVGVEVEAEPRRDLAHLRAGGVEVEAPAELRRLVAEHDVLGDREHGDEHEVLVDHADARHSSRRRGRRNAARRRRAGSRPRRPGTGRRARSSGWTCRHRSRRGGSGSHRARR